MDKMRQFRMATAFGARHRAARPFVLPNVWDAMSARIFAEAGFEALATTSGGVAWALGWPDGEVAPWEEVVAATGRIVRAARLPVTADIETGYGETPAEVGGHVAEIIDTGVVGVNLEDSRKGSLRATADAAARIAAARSAADDAGIPIVINARCDEFLRQKGDGDESFASATDRCREYIAAGADCVYPIGLRDPAVIEAFAKAVDAPVNITGRPGMPGAVALGRMGVARITLATQPALVAMSTISALAADFRAQDSFDGLKSRLTHADAQALFRTQRRPQTKG
jgi:2-methylisocitrate lyase-like PEP mutase family enzyme